MNIGDYFGLKNTREVLKWDAYTLIEADMHFNWDLFFDINFDFKFAFSNRENSIYLGLGAIEFSDELTDFFKTFESLPPEVFFFYQQSFYKDKRSTILPKIQITKTKDAVKIRYFKENTKENGQDLEITTYKDMPARNIIFQETHEPDEVEWKNIFKKAKSFLTEHPKVVLSRKTQFKFKNRVHVPKFFLNMFKEDCYNYFVQTKLHYFVGSSPERLLKFSNGSFFTEALAGTRSLDKKEELLASKKDQAEQKIVLDEVINSIQTLSSKVEVGDTTIHEYKNIAHLKTEVKATPLTTNIFQWIDAIHPTPAVCGLPRDKAFEFLKNTEPYKRENYASSIGIIQRNQMDIAVAIRCAEVYRNLVTAYTGVGVVMQSEVELEWDELELKLENIRTALEI